MDAIGSFVVAASAPLDIRMWRVDTQPASKLTGKATTVLTLVRELSIMSVGQPLRVRIILASVTKIHLALLPQLDQGLHNKRSAVLDSGILLVCMQPHGRWTIDRALAELVPISGCRT